MPDSTIASTETRLLHALRAVGSPERAEREKAYQKSRWEHWGVPLPAMDAAIRETLGDLTQQEALSLCVRLWREPVWDLRIVSARILARKSIEPDDKVWAFVTERLADLDGWAVADNLASGRLALPHRRTRPARHRRSLDREPAFVDAPCGARLHPSVDEGEA